MKNMFGKKKVNILNDTACVKRKLKATLSRIEIPHPGGFRLITGADRDTLEDPPSGIRGKDLGNQEPHALQWDVEMSIC